MATPESYGIDMGADTEATFGTSADSMGVCFKHTPGGELSGSLGGQPVSEGSKYSSLDSGECESGSRPPSLDRRQAFDTIADAFVGESSFPTQIHLHEFLPIPSQALSDLNRDLEGLSLERVRLRANKLAHQFHSYQVRAAHSKQAMGVRVAHNSIRA